MENILKKHAKIIQLVIVVFFMSNTFNFNQNNALAALENDYTVTSIGDSTINDNFIFSEPSTEAWGEYVILKMNETNQYMRDIGKPMLPVLYKTYILPFGSIVNDIKCQPVCITEKVIYDKIKPASNVWFIPALNSTTNFGNPVNEVIIENDSIYSNSTLFPEEWYDYDLRCGLKDNEHVVYLTLRIYPVKYSPKDYKIYYANGVDINISYQEPSTSDYFSEKYDMVIITSSKFKKPLQTFVDYKNNIGVSTILKTTEEIYDQYPGRDKPEQIKYFIKDAIETWDIKYVLLVGGLKNYFYAKDRDDTNQGSSAWHVPVRYINNDIGYCHPISDYYYADIYKYNDTLGYEFEDWDSNDNGIFGEGNYSVFNETIDLCADVHLGRLPCVNIFEVKTVINKIIRYESSSHVNESWFKRMVSITGDVSKFTIGKPNGEIFCDKAVEYMGDLVESTMISTSNIETGGPVPVVRDITREISKGAGFVHFEGHSSAIAWGVYWPEGKFVIKGNIGLEVYDFWRISNFNKLPVMVIGGCYNSLFNITLVNSIKSSRFGNPNYYFTYGCPTRKCFAWKLVSMPYRGAIATLGSTSSESMNRNLSFGPVGFSIGHELDYNFFYQIGKNNVSTLGDAYSYAICKLVQENPIRTYETHIVATWELFGDPSLKIGGYSS